MNHNMKQTHIWRGQMHYYLLLTLLFFIVTSISSCKNMKQSAEESIKQRLDSLFTARYAINGDSSMISDFPGGAVLVMKGDEIIFDKGYGIANYENGHRIDGNTFFNIASCSKQFTATAILKLAQEGKINIEDNVSKYFPEFKSEIFKKVKIKHLLSHSSGIPDERPRDDRHFMLTATDMQSIEYLKKLDHLNFEPGTEYEYMNPTFQILYSIIEKVTGQPFVEYMRKSIFTPAEMSSTLYFEPDATIPNMAHGYVPADESTDKQSSDNDLSPEAAAAKKALNSTSEKKIYTPHKGFLSFSEYDYGEETFFATKADGGIYTSTHEFAKWEKALRDNKIISNETKETAHSKINNISGSKYSLYQNRPDTWYGYGWFVEERAGMPKKVYHTGDNGGFQIYAGRFPDKQILVLVFENRNDKDRWSMVQEIDSILKKANWLE